MFVVRESQIDAMRSRARAGFVDRVTAYLRSEQADGLDGQALRDRVVKGVARARSFGIVMEADVVRFVLVDMALGPDFEAAPGAEPLLRLLRDPALDGGEKARRLRDMAIERAVPPVGERARR